MEPNITLPDSGRAVRLRGYAMEREDEILDLQERVATGDGGFKELRSAVLEACYPELVLEGLTSADLAHLVNLTLRYSIGGPLAVKNLLGSGAGGDQPH